MCDSSASSGSAQPELQSQNERTRVTKWSFPAHGANTGWHRHEYDYVVVPLFDGVLDILDADGNTTSVELRNGQSYFRKAGVEHDVINANNHAVAFVEIEFLE